MSSIQTSDEIGNSNSDTSRRRSIRCVTVEPVVVLVSIAVGMTIPLTQQYIYKRMMEEYAPGVVFNHSTCKTSANATILVEQHSSKWMMLLTLSFMIPTFFSSLILGSISDKYGRKFTLLLPIIGSSFKQLITVLVVGFNLRIEYLFIGNIVDGLCGGASIILMSCFAYISDITLPDRRMLRYVIVECSASLGVIVSSIGTGYLINYTGFLWPNVIAIFLISLNAVYSMTLQETVAKQNSNVATFGFGYLLEPLKLYVKNDEHGRRWKLAIIMAIFVLVNMADFGRIDCEALHLLSYPFCWSSIILGYYSATAKTAGMITALILAKLVSRWIGGLDLVLIVIACLSGAAYEIVFPLIKQMSILFSSMHAIFMLFVNCTYSIRKY